MVRGLRIFRRTYSTFIKFVLLGTLPALVFGCIAQQFEPDKFE